MHEVNWALILYMEDKIRYENVINQNLKIQK